jgi:hypothetical protein
MKSATVDVVVGARGQRAILFFVGHGGYLRSLTGGKEVVSVSGFGGRWLKYLRAVRPNAALQASVVTRRAVYGRTEKQGTWKERLRERDRERKRKMKRKRGERGERGAAAGQARTTDESRVPRLEMSAFTDFGPARKTRKTVKCFKGSWGVPRWVAMGNHLPAVPVRRRHHHTAHFEASCFILFSPNATPD